MNRIIVSAPFGDLTSKDVRFLQEASKLGELHVLLWTDEAIVAATGKPSKFPQAERHYFVQASRYVSHVHLVGAGTEALLQLGFKPDGWVVTAQDDTADKQAFCCANSIGYHVVTDADLGGFPATPAQPSRTSKKVVVTGCYDWFHTGHIAFFEEVSALGDLYVVVGNDENLRLLKGEGHPLFPAEERRYDAGSIRYVTEALVSSGMGWMDAEPEILTVIKPDIYAVNEDGDKPEKKEFCNKHGIQYTVLKRVPKEGLKKRSSTDLRGF